MLWLIFQIVSRSFVLEGKVRTRNKQTEEKRQVEEAETKQVLKSDECSYMYYV